MWLHSSLEVCSHMAFYTLSKGFYYAVEIGVESR